MRSKWGAAPSTGYSTTSGMTRCTDLIAIPSLGWIEQSGVDQCGVLNVLKLARDGRAYVWRPSDVANMTLGPFRDIAEELAVPLRPKPVG